MLVRRERQRGFTLIELIFVVALLGIISVVVGRVLFQAYQTFLVSQNISETDWRGLLVLERIVDDIRTLRSVNDITTVQANALTFTNINGNSIQYQLSGTTLLRSSQILATGIQNFNLGYLDKSGATTAVAANVRYIQISVTAFQNNISQTFSTMAAVRSNA